MPSQILDYTRTASEKRRRWPLLIGFSVGFFVLQLLTPRKTPPGWPTSWDYALMLLLPIGAVIMSATSSLPGWVIGSYGLGGGCTFLLAQLTDSDLKYRLSDPGADFWFVFDWCAFLLGAWVICRCSVLLRGRRTA